MNDYTHRLAAFGLGVSRLKRTEFRDLGLVGRRLIQTVEGLGNKSSFLKSGSPYILQTPFIGPLELTEGFSGLYVHY